MLTLNKLVGPSFDQLFHEGGPYDIEISPLICYAKQWTGFYMIWTSVMKELNAALEYGFS